AASGEAKARTTMMVESMRCASTDDAPSQSSGGPASGRLLRAAPRLDDALRRGWVLRELVRRPPGPRHQLTATVRTPEREHALGARATERALERADQRVRPVGGQVAVAALAARSQL